MSKSEQASPPLFSFDTSIFEHIFRAAVAAVEPSVLVQSRLRLENYRLFIDVHESKSERKKSLQFDLDAYERIHVIGIGKGGVSFFQGLDKVLGKVISGGIVVSAEQHRFSHPNVSFRAGSHPVPGFESLDAGQAVLNYIDRKIGGNDLVFFLITGGASALMAVPVPGITMEEKAELHRFLLSCGADIREINTVRRAMSAVKGGKLAERAAPATVITLVLSDIIDSPLHDVGSGPSIFPPASSDDAASIICKYRLSDSISPVLKAIISEYKPPVDFHGANKNAFLIGDNRTALKAAEIYARSVGFETRVLTASDNGEASDAAKRYAQLLMDAMNRKVGTRPPILLLGGGELTVTLPSNSKLEIGKGGRNQHFMLQLIKELKGKIPPGVKFYAASIGTDGIDGPTDAAGAWIGHGTFGRISAMGLDVDDYLRRFDSYNFFRTLGQSIITGPTGTNVMDLRMFGV